MAFIYHQLFCDESGKFHNPKTQHVAFAGICATPDKLDAFDREWRTLLRSYEISSLHMKMISQLDLKVGYRFQPNQTVDERVDLLIPFADCINKHLEMGFLQAWDLKGFERIPYEARILLGGSKDPMLWAFVRGLSEIVQRMGEDDRLSVICDDDEATAWNMYLHYRAFGKEIWEMQKMAIALSFANDVHFPALQAADMAAFLTRYQSQEEFYKVPNKWKRLYVRLKTEPQPPYGSMRWFEGIYNEKKLTATANALKELADKRKRDEQSKAKRMDKFRRDNAATNASSPQQDKSRTGGRKGSKDTKAEG